MKKLTRAFEKNVLNKTSFSENLDLLELVSSMLLLSKHSLKFLAKIEPHVLYRLSPFSSWLANEFCSRCEVSAVYQQSALLRYSLISTPFQPNLSNFLLAHVLLKQTLAMFKDPKTLCNRGEVMK